MSKKPPRGSSRAAEYIAAIADSARLIEGAARQAEEERTLPRLIVDRLRELKLFWLKTPASLGGDELDPLDFCDVAEEIAYVEASAAWTVMIGNGNTGVAAGWLPDDGVKEIFSGSAMPIFAGQYSPRGQAVHEDGGYRVSGRWSFCSGIMHSSWVVGGCRNAENGDWVVVCAPKDEAVVHDTWHVAGLQGTGSNDFSLEDVYVPESHTIIWPQPTPKNPAGRIRQIGRGGPLYQQPPSIFLSNELSPFAVGVAQRAFDDMISMAEGTVRTAGGATLSERAAFQKALGRAEATIQSARLLSRDSVAECWDRVNAGEEIDALLAMSIRARHTLAMELCLNSVADLFRYGGGRVLALNNPMQRHYRNLMAASQHVFISDEYYEHAGATYLQHGSN